MKLWQLALNVVLFQMTWISAAFAYEAVSIISLLLLAMTQAYSPESLKKVILAILVGLLLGIGMDGLLGWLGVYRFPEASVLALPSWLLIMWLAFSLTLCVSFHWALSKPILFVALCALMGPFSYGIGREINIIQFNDGDVWMMISAWATWAVIFLLVWYGVINKRLTRTTVMKGE